MYRKNDAECPYCKVPLVAAVFGTRCAHCNGNFVRLSYLQYLVGKFDLTMTDQVTAAVGMPTRPSAVKCPTCHTNMLVRHFYGQVVDLCADHGMWFDAKEFTHACEDMINAPRAKARELAALDDNVETSFVSMLRALWQHWQADEADYQIPLIHPDDMPDEPGNE